MVGYWSWSATGTGRALEQSSSSLVCWIFLSNQDQATRSVELRQFLNLKSSCWERERIFGSLHNFDRTLKQENLCLQSYFVGKLSQILPKSTFVLVCTVTPLLWKQVEYFLQIFFWKSKHILRSFVTIYLCWKFLDKTTLNTSGKILTSTCFWDDLPPFIDFAFFDIKFCFKINSHELSTKFVNMANLQQDFLKHKLFFFFLGHWRVKFKGFPFCIF